MMVLAVGFFQTAGTMFVPSVAGGTGLPSQYQNSSPANPEGVVLFVYWIRGLMRSTE